MAGKLEELQRTKDKGKCMEEYCTAGKQVVLAIDMHLYPETPLYNLCSMPILKQFGDGSRPCVDECMRRWKTLRDRYVRELKKVNGGKSGDEGPPYVPTWPLFKVLGFLMDSVKHRR